MKTMSIKYKNTLSYGLAILFFFLPFSSIQAQNAIGVNTATPKSDFEVNGSFAKKVTLVTANTTLDATHSIVICNNSGTAMTITLPTATTCTGRIYTIKKGTSTTDITIATTSSQTIDGASTLVLSDQYAAETLISNGTEWKRNSKHLPPYPLGEISYFSADVPGRVGTNITFTNNSNGSSNMVLCQPITAFVGRGDFDNGGSDNGRLRYIGKNAKTFHIACTVSGTLSTTGSSRTFVFGIAQNGGVIAASKILNRIATTTDMQSTALHLMVTMNPNDYLELYMGNVSNTSTFELFSFNLFALGMD